MATKKYVIISLYKFIIGSVNLEYIAKIKIMNILTITDIKVLEHLNNTN